MLQIETIRQKFLEKKHSISIANLNMNYNFAETLIEKPKIFTPWDTIN